MMLFEQHPYFVQRRSRASGYRRLAAAEYGRLAVWEHSPFSELGAASYPRWTVHQCWCSISTVGLFSFFSLAFVCHAYPTFVLRSRSHLKP